MTRVLTQKNNDEKKVKQNKVAEKKFKVQEIKNKKGSKVWNKKKACNTSKITKKPNCTKKSTKENNGKTHKLTKNNTEEDNEIEEVVVFSSDEENDGEDEDYEPSDNISEEEDDDDFIIDEELNDDDDDDNDDDEYQDIEEEKPSPMKKIKMDSTTKKQDQTKANLTYDEPAVEAINKLEQIDLPRDKQLTLFNRVHWTIADPVDTASIDFEQWLNENSNRSQYFFGPDKYIYPNPSTMQKFINCLKKGEVLDKSVNLPFTPMERLISSNPRICVGISGVRHIQKAGGLAVWPVFYMSKDQYNERNTAFSTKVLRVNFPLHKLDEMTEAMVDLCRGLGFELETKK